MKAEASMQVWLRKERKRKDGKRRQAKARQGRTIWENIQNQSYLPDF